MSEKNVQQQQPTAAQAAGSVREPAGNPAEPQAPSNSNPIPLRLTEEIRDPLGNFSEQIGAYFG